MMKSTDLYIDLGTANTLIYARNTGFLLNQPSVLALRQTTSRPNQFRAIGQQAKSMLGKNPDNISVLRPLKEGVIADFENTARMLHQFVSQVRQQMTLFRPRMLISLPCQVTSFEKTSVEEIGRSLGAKKVHLLHEPVAGAIGAGLPVFSNRGSMVVDIGGGTTEIALIAMGGIITSRAVRIGGANIDDAIIHLLANKYRFAIGELTAEKVKIQVGSAIPAENQLEIAGIDMTTGLPKRFLVTSEMIAPAIDSVVSQIVFSIKEALEKCPPEISSDLVDHGIMLTGGGALIKGITTKISCEIGIPVHIANDPLCSVAFGGARIIENFKLFDALEQPA